MTGIFDAVSDKAQSLISKIAVLNPLNPFYTAQYMAYQRTQGCIPWILVYGNDMQPNVYCPAFMKTSHLRRSLEIPSMPDIPVDEPFWPELINFCRQKGISNLSVNSFGSQGGMIPRLDHEIYRKTRWEYVLNLKLPDIFMKMSKGHAYRIKRAKKMGLEMQRNYNPEAVRTHARLISTSMRRRQNRGENVTTSAPTNDLFKLTESGAGEIFQAVLAGQVVSSNCILMAEKSGYSHTQGTSPEGMNCGAAHFLIHGIASALRQEGKEVLNLGGTDDPNPESGLVKFKTGFGGGMTEKIELEAAEFIPSSIVSSFLRRYFMKENI